MITLRPSQERGYADHGWLKSYHSFSFAGYYDAQHMGWGNLRVINEDWIAPGTGFGTHGHRDMEIVTYVLEGALAHQDSLGHIQSIVPGEVQRMSAGTGVQHSEFNHAPDATTHLLQIWIQPNRLGVAPGYEQKTIAPADKLGRLCLVAAPEGEHGVLRIQADARLYAGLFDAGQTASLALPAGRMGYVHLVRGALTVNGLPLRTGDAALLANEASVTLTDAQAAEVLVFDLSA
ncbi:MAG: quercetin 2,3-dioxygenase [Comamonadaceae bacterium CG1_02_60_18]|nr:MAG: quercetin 2,3-dioxygenase [Comamonadaceae bacterium CG1_02_60_18]PIQ51175.1 MAG: quercetin 2,3-dioxygenase [Comamonadaceae bacterium CG12_big_fil_rev_8_21_14_0_65_59_15]